MTPLLDKEIISTNPGGKAFMIFGLVCCFVVYCVMILTSSHTHYISYSYITI